MLVIEVGPHIALLQFYLPCMRVNFCVFRRNFEACNPKGYYGCCHIHLDLLGEIRSEVYLGSNHSHSINIYCCNTFCKTHTLFIIIPIIVVKI